LCDVDLFFRRQAEACTKANAAIVRFNLLSYSNFGLTVSQLDATVAATSAHMARLEARVA
jgi:hypothetical protein